MTPKKIPMIPLAALVSLIFFLAIFLFLVVVFITVFSTVKKALNRSILPEIRAAGQGLSEEEEPPRSLNGCESIHLPRILEDFPDFNITLAYTLAEEELRKRLSAFPELMIHRVVLSDYKRASYEKTVILQAALQYREDGRLRQKRYLLHYSCLLGDESGARQIAANCPNCGAPVSDPSARTCEYCDSLLVHVMKNNWVFTEVKEG